MAHCFVLLTNQAHAESTIVIPPGKYEITANMSLPHIADILTGSKTIQVSCLHKQNAGELFPILQHPSFADCSLKEGFSNGQDSKNSMLYTFHLYCENTYAASGTAEFSVGQNNFSARLSIKMGAKNMTMTQHLDAKRITECQAQ